MKGPNSRNRMGRTIGAFALGATTGSVLALLFAPAAGPVTRRRIAMKIRTYEKATARQLAQAKRQLTRQATQLREVAEEKLGQTREWLVERVTPGNHHKPVHHRVAA